VIGKIGDVIESTASALNGLFALAVFAAIVFCLLTTLEAERIIGQARTGQAGTIVLDMNGIGSAEP
jgi:hypothetical protein